MTGRDYWLTVLRPFARDGFRTGTVDDLEVVLLNEAGAEVHLPRPSAGWHVPVLPSLDHTADADLEASRGLRYLMKVGSNRLELSI